MACRFIKPKIGPSKGTRIKSKLFDQLKAHLTPEEANKMYNSFFKPRFMKWLGVNWTTNTDPSKIGLLNEDGEPFLSQQGTAMGIVNERLSFRKLFEIGKGFIDVPLLTRNKETIQRNFNSLNMSSGQTVTTPEFIDRLLATNEISEFNRTQLERFKTTLSQLRLNPSVTVHEALIEKSTGGAALGAWIPGRIGLAMYAKDMDTIALSFLHETVHEFTTPFLDESNPTRTTKQQQLVNEITELFNLAKTRGRDREENYLWYGLTNEKEFLTQAFSSPKFRQYLDSISTGKKKKQSILKRLLNYLKSLFNLPIENDELTILDQMLDIESDLYTNFISKNKGSKDLSLSNDFYFTLNEANRNDGSTHQSDQNYELLVAAPADTYDKIVGDSSTVELDEESDVYTKAGRQGERVSSFMQSFKRDLLDRDEFDWTQWKAMKRWKATDPDVWNGIPKDSKQFTEEGYMTYDEYLEKLREINLKGRLRGSIGHNILQSVVHPERAGELAQERAGMLDEGGFKDFQFTWLMEKVPHIFSALGSNYFERVDEGQRDKVSTEVKLFSDILGIGGTADIVIGHADGTISIGDLKLGHRFNTPDHRILLYGHSKNRNITQSRRDMAKLQIALYAVMMKVENPDLKFRNLDVLWAPREGALLNPDTKRRVDMSNYLPMIEGFLRNERPEVYAKLQTMPEFKKIFDPAEYSTGYSPALQKELTLNREDLTVSQRMELKLQQLKELVQYDLDPHLRLDRDEVVTSKFAAAKRLAKEIAELSADPNIKLEDWNEDLSFFSEWLGTTSNVQNPYIGIYNQLREARKKKFNDRVDRKRKKFLALLRPVYGQYLDRRKGVGAFAAMGEKLPLVKGKLNMNNPHELWEFAYKTVEIDGQMRRVYNQTAEDWAAKERELGRPISKEEKALVKFVTDTYESYFENSKSEYGTAVANQVATSRPIGRGIKHIKVSNLELANGITNDGKRISDRVKPVPFQYNKATFVPMVPRTGEEIRSEHGLLSRENWEFIKERYFTFAIENQFEQWGNVDEAIPMKYLPNGSREFGNDYSIDMEEQFDRFVRAYTFKEELDDVYAFGKGIQYWLESEEAGPDHARTASFLKTQIDLQIRGVKQRDLDLFRRAGRADNNTKFNWVKALRTFKMLASAPIMWLKPINGTANGIFTYIFTTKDAFTGSVITKLAGINSSVADFTTTDLARAHADWLSMQKDAMAGKLNQNKTFLFMKKFNYLPDNYDWATNSSDLMTRKNQMFSTSTMLMFHSLPEEWIAGLVMSAQLHNMKIEKGEFAGTSLFDMYDPIEVTEDGVTFTDLQWKRDSNGRPVVRGVEQVGRGDTAEFVEITELTAREIAKMKRVYERLHGSYRQDERTKAEYFVFGEVFLQFKKFLPNILKNALGSKGEETTLGHYEFTGDTHNGQDVMRWVARVTEGRWLVVGKMIQNFLGLRLQVKNPTNALQRFWNRFALGANEDYSWSELSDGQKAQFMDFMVTMGFIMAMQAGYLLMFGGSSDDDSWKKFAGRIVNDFSQQYNFLELSKNLFQNGWPASLRKGHKTLISTWEMMVSGAWYLGGYEDLALTDAGTLGGWAEFKRSIPFLSSYRDIVHFMENTEDFSDYVTTKGIK